MVDEGNLTILVDWFQKLDYFEQQISLTNLFTSTGKKACGRQLKPIHLTITLLQLHCGWIWRLFWSSCREP